MHGKNICHRWIKHQRHLCLSKRQYYFCKFYYLKNILLFKYLHYFLLKQTTKYNVFTFLTLTKKKKLLWRFPCSRALPSFYLLEVTVNDPIFNASYFKTAAFYFLNLLNERKVVFPEDFAMWHGVRDNETSPKWMATKFFCQVKICGLLKNFNLCQLGLLISYYTQLTVVFWLWCDTCEGEISGINIFFWERFCGRL